jgi:arabinofuranosyltransferase
VRGARSDDALVALAALVPLGLYLLRERAIAGGPGLPLDDAWIHLHFARNIAEGAGFSYNPGRPMAGSTAPLWTLLLAGVFALAGPSLAAAKTVGVVVTVAAALVLRRAAIVWGSARGVALVVAVAFLWSRPVAWGALSGMEVSLAALLVAAALVAHGHEAEVATAAFAALAVLARPEAALLVPLLLLAAPFRARRLAVFAVVTVAIVAPAVWFNLKTTGALIPATAAAKVEGGLLGWLLGLREPAATTWIHRPLQFFGAWVRWLGSTNWLLPVSLVPAIWIAGRRWGRALGVPALALVVHPLGMALLAPYRDPAFQAGRYSIHLLPIAFLLFTVLAGEFGRRRRAALVGYLVVALVMLPVGAERYGWAVQNINAMQVHLGRWVDGHVPPDARLAVNDIGAIAYFSRREIIDLMGLVTPEVIPYHRRPHGILDYVRETCPDYVIVFPSWFPELAARRELVEPIYRVRLERNEVSGAAEMVVYRVARCTV